MHIREADEADNSAIRAVVEAAFGQRDEADLIERLVTDGDAVLSLVAEENQDEDPPVILGHILFSKMSAPFRALGLAPVSAHPDKQGQGIGSALIREGLARASQMGWEGVFVLGEPDYYRRFGFDPQVAQGFDCPYAGPYLMALSLEGDLPVRRGKVAYAPAFAGMG